jgi:hypothetical protein
LQVQAGRRAMGADLSGLHRWAKDVLHIRIIKHLRRSDRNRRLMLLMLRVDGASSRKNQGGEK